jgi:hypothetical protein
VERLKQDARGKLRDAEEPRGVGKMGIELGKMGIATNLLGNIDVFFFYLFY